VSEPQRHRAFVHHDVKGPEERTSPLLAECADCKWTEKGFTRRGDARAAADKHITETDPNSTTERNLP